MRTRGARWDGRKRFAMKTRCHPHLIKALFALSVALTTGSASRAAGEPGTAELQEPTKQSAGGEDLSSRASDPTASLMAFNLQFNWNDYHGRDLAGKPDDAWGGQFQAVIPFTLLDQPNLLRFSAPFQFDGRGPNGLQSVSLFDLVMFDESWGRWGIGPLMSVDPTGSAPDRFVLGPAIGAVGNVNKRLKLGLFSQNLFWSDTAISQLQPVIAYQLGHGWSLSSGNLQFTYDWKAGRWVNVPVGAQVSKLAKLGKLPVRFSVNPQYNLRERGGFAKWNVSATFTALFPTH